MKIGYVGDVSHRTVTRHVKQTTLGMREDRDVYVLERAEIRWDTDKPMLNTSEPVRELLASKELCAKFNALYLLDNDKPLTYLYGFMGKHTTSDLIEVAYSTKFMVGDVGPDVGFTQGVGIAAKNPFQAIPNLSNLVQGLQAMGYLGEFTIGITKDYQLSGLTLGHFTGGFALFLELAKGSMDTYYDFCISGNEPKGLHTNGVSACTLMSMGPFPGNVSDESIVEIPPDAEAHTYVCEYNNARVAYAGAWGSDITETKRRVRLTLGNCSAINPGLQYRIDYGCKLDFVINHEEWLKFGGSLPYHT